MATITELMAALSDPQYYKAVGGGLLDAYNRGAVGGLLGTPVDMANGVLNAGKMAAGYIGHQTGLLSGDQMPQPDMMPVGGSEWIGQKMQDAGMVSPNRNMPAEMLAGLAGIPLTAMAAAKAGPMVEKGIGQAMANAQMPSTLNLPQYSGQRGAIAYHGSPHKFDKFKTEAIGTGEGAQAYGRGLYLAEEPEVAKEYQRALGRPDSTTLTKSQDIAAWAHSTGVKGNDDAVRILEDEIARLDAYGKFDGKKLDRNHYMEALTMVKQNAAPSNGNLYKTDIPDEALAKMLDWDKPLSQQAPEVRAAIKKSDFYKSAQARFKETGQWYDDPSQKTGEGLLKYLRSGTSDVAGPYGGGLAEDYLKQQGIPGIRYLDGGSRGVGAGTSNYVAFDPEMIRILERNGQPTGLLPWQPGEWGNK